MLLGQQLIPVFLGLLIFQMGILLHKQSILHMLYSLARGMRPPKRFCLTFYLLYYENGYITNGLC